jgi:hypothetical protein
VSEGIFESEDFLSLPLDAQVRLMGREIERLNSEVTQLISLLGSTVDILGEVNQNASA